MRPNNVNILGQNYSITYVDKPSEVDIFKRASYWGQIDFWTRSIRLFDDKTTQTDESILHNLLHETIHGITNALKIDFGQANDDEVVTDLLALALADVLTRNGWIVKELP